MMTDHMSGADDWDNFSEFTANEDFTCNLKKNSMENSLDIDPRKNVASLSERIAAFLSQTKPADCKANGHLDAYSEDLEDLLSTNKIWKSLVSGCGVPRKFEWSSSFIRFQCFPFLSEGRSREEKITKILDDDDRNDTELRKLMDMHSLIMCYDAEDRKSDVICGEKKEGEGFSVVQTADEVIEEIEEILMTADEQDAAFVDELEQQTGIIITNEDPFVEISEAETEISTCIMESLNATSPFNQDDSDRTKVLKHMSFAELNEELSNLENSVKYLSESLLKELNYRDELLYEKEVRNTFITKILEVQYKQEQFQQNSKAYNGRFKFGKLTKSLSMSNASVSATPGRFLTTVIPFDDGSVPSMQGLQALIKLLDAIKEDSSEVPSLITDYILKVLCPASAQTSTLNL